MAEQSSKEPKQGVPGDALAPFADALAKAAKAAPANTADPLVSGAFALGWQMAELYRPQQRRTTVKLDDDLPSLGALDNPQRVEILITQVLVAIKKLAPPVKAAGLAPVDVSALEASLEHQPPAAATIEALHHALLRTLTATDFRLGKSYELGCSLADTCRKPDDQDSLKLELGGQNLANLLGALDDLSSAFPPHAAHSVAASIESWARWLEKPEEEEAHKLLPTGRTSASEETQQNVLSVLPRQGELWRALLSGEKQGTAMLDTENYLDAARDVTTRMRKVLRSLIVKIPQPVLLVVVLLLIGGGILIYEGGSAQTVAGAGSILAALGVTWKGVGGALGQLAGKLEQPLWGAVLDDAIANTITLLPDKASYDHRARQATALAMSPKRDVHQASDPGH